MASGSGSNFVPHKKFTAWAEYSEGVYPVSSVSYDGNVANIDILVSPTSNRRRTYKICWRSRYSPISAFCEAVLVPGSKADNEEKIIQRLMEKGDTRSQTCETTSRQVKLLARLYPLSMSGESVKRKNKNFMKLSSARLKIRVFRDSNVQKRMKDIIKSGLASFSREEKRKLFSEETFVFVFNFLKVVDKASSGSIYRMLEDEKPDSDTESVESIVWLSGPSKPKPDAEKSRTGRKRAAQTSGSSEVEYHGFSRSTVVNNGSREGEPARSRNKRVKVEHADFSVFDTIPRLPMPAAAHEARGETDLSVADNTFLREADASISGEKYLSLVAEERELERQLRERLTSTRIPSKVVQKKMLRIETLREALKTADEVLGINEKILEQAVFL